MLDYILYNKYYSLKEPSIEFIDNKFKISIGNIQDEIKISENFKYYIERNNNELSLYINKNINDITHKFLNTHSISFNNFNLNHIYKIKNNDIFFFDINIIHSIINKYNNIIIFSDKISIRKKTFKYKNINKINLNNSIIIFDINSYSNIIDISKVNLVNIKKIFLIPYINYKLYVLNICNKFNINNYNISVFFTNFINHNLNNNITNNINIIRKYITLNNQQKNLFINLKLSDFYNAINNNSSHIFDIIQCPICLDDTNIISSTNCCNHKFCPSCIYLYIYKKNKCPICHSSININNISNSNFNNPFINEILSIHNNSLFNSIIFISKKFFNNILKFNLNNIIIYNNHLTSLINININNKILVLDDSLSYNLKNIKDINNIFFFDSNNKNIINKKIYPSYIISKKYNIIIYEISYDSSFESPNN